MENQKILFVSAYWEKGGAEKVFRITLEISKGHYNVDFFVPNEGPSSSLSLGKLYSKIKLFKPDIVHIHNYHTPLIFLVLAWLRMMGHKFIIAYTAHDHRFLCPESYYGYYKKGVFYPYQKPPSTWRMIWDCHSNKNRFINVTKKIKWFFWFRLLQIPRIVSVILAPSEYLKGQFLLDKVCQKLDVRLLRYPTLLEKKEPKKHSNFTGKLKMVFIGRLSFEKGLLELMDLLADQNLEKWDYLLDIYGSGPLEPDLSSKIEKTNLSSIVKMRGNLEPSLVHETLTKYDVMVFSSIWNENAPLVLVEGALAGLSLLTVNFGGSLEIAKFCGNYFLFNPRDQSSFNVAFKECYKSLQDGSVGTTMESSELQDLLGYDSYLKTYASIIMEKIQVA